MVFSKLLLHINTSKANSRITRIETIMRALRLRRPFTSKANSRITRIETEAYIDTFN